VVLAPLPNPFHMVRATEVIVVFGFLQPSALAGGFAGLAAWRPRTVALTPHVAIVGIKEDLAVLTLALSDVTCHWPESPQVNDRPGAVWKEENGEENERRRRGKKREEIYSNCIFRKKTERG